MKHLLLIVCVAILAMPLLAQDQPAIPQEFNWLIAVVAFLFFLSEALAQIPSVKANSIFQLIAGILKSLRDALGSKKDPPSNAKQG